MKRYGLLIVDDEKEILRSLMLTFEEDFEVFYSIKWNRCTRYYKKK